MHYVERHWCCGGPVDKHTLEGRSCSVYLMHLNINPLHSIKGNYRSAQVRKKIYYTCDVLFWSLNLHSAHMSWLTVWLFDCKVLLWESKIWCLFSLQPTKWSHHTSMWNMKDIETLGAWWLICQQPLLSLKSPYIHLPLVKTRVLFFFKYQINSGRLHWRALLGYKSSAALRTESSAVDARRPFSCSFYSLTVQVFTFLIFLTHGYKLILKRSPLCCCCGWCCCCCCCCVSVTQKLKEAARCYRLH